MLRLSYTRFSTVILLFSFACNNLAEKQEENNRLVFQGYDTIHYYLNGEKIFKSDCNTCHNAKVKSDNYLSGVVQRVGKDYLKLYVTKQDSLIQSKDEYALKLKEVWASQDYSHNFNYSDEQLRAIIEYLR